MHVLGYMINIWQKGKNYLENLEVSRNFSGNPNNAQVDILILFNGLRNIKEMFEVFIVNM